MSDFDQNSGAARRAVASRFSAATPFMSARATLTASLLIVCAATHIYITNSNIAPDSVQLSAAHPDLNTLALVSPAGDSPVANSAVANSAVANSAVANSAVANSAVANSLMQTPPLQTPDANSATTQLSFTEPSVATTSAVQSAVVESPRASRWKNRHLDNRHYASTSSLANTSELDYLCIEQVSCGWFVNMDDETNCNKSTRGREFRVRLESDQVVRDFQSRCVGYGLVFVGTESGEEEIITRMVKRSDSLKVNSISNAGIVKTQQFDSRGSSGALDIAVRAAGLHSELKVSDNMHR